MAEGDRFGPYVVHECLGTGGMATVHRASIELEDDDTRDVALKRLLPQYAEDKRFVEDLIREGKLAAQLQHPNIVRILELGRIGRTYFIAMDLVRGRSLMSLMRKAHRLRKRPSIAVVLALMAEVLDALDHAHAFQIVHRDLTPSNLIVTEEGHIKVIDFGVAKALAGALQTSSGLAKGKLGYMSLEAVMGKHVDARADLFSAGVVMWELIAMRRLFRGSTDIDLVNAVRAHEIDPPSDFNNRCSPEVDRLVMRALAQRPDDRWGAASEMATAIAELRAHHPATARDVRAWTVALVSETASELPRSDTDREPETSLVPLLDVDVSGGYAGPLAPEAGASSGAYPADAYASDAYAPDDYALDGYAAGSNHADDRAPTLAAGSDVNTYEDLTLDGADELDDAEPAPRFREVDTVVTSAPGKPRRR